LLDLKNPAQQCNRGYMRAPFGLNPAQLTRIAGSDTIHRMATCSACGAFNQHAERYCSACGSALTARRKIWLVITTGVAYPLFAMLAYYSASDCPAHQARTSIPGLSMLSALIGLIAAPIVVFWLVRFKPTWLWAMALVVTLPISLVVWLLAGIAGDYAGRCGGI
jgi:hypothetical protein